MTDDNRDTTRSESGLDRLKEELGDYLHACARHRIGSVGQRLGHLTDRIGRGDDGGVSAIGRRVPGGESPAKTLVGERAKSALGGGGKAGGTKVTNIVETIDIGLPRRTVYDAWTRLEEFSTFAKGVQNVSMPDEVESDWQVKVAFSNRGWKATIQEQIPDERIVWTSEGAKGTTRGAVSFHELTPNLTRVVVVVEYHPSGFFEKTGNLWRAQGRRLRLDLKHFQRHVTLTDKEELGEGWRGEIRDGEVVLDHEDAVERERRESGEDEYEYDEEDEYGDIEGEEGRYDDGEDDYDDEEEDGYDDEGRQGR